MKIIFFLLFFLISLKIILSDNIYSFIFCKSLILDSLFLFFFTTILNPIAESFIILFKSNIFYYLNLFRLRKIQFFLFPDILYCGYYYL